MKRKLCLRGIKYIEDDGTIHLATNVGCIDDLIEMAENNDPTLKYNIDMRKVHAIRNSLCKLKGMVGLKSVKQMLVKQIVYFLQGFHNEDMLHTVIQGPPGVGKTMLAQIIGQIYHDLNIFDMGRFKRNNDRKDHEGSCETPPPLLSFKIARRSDLIGEYLGTTAKKTQAVIDSCKGGVLLIDEAYALGNSEGKDMYSKECIDTLNQNLSENKGNFLCIIAGYQKSLDSSFFRYNEGLRRRFPFVYTLEKYTVEELFEILKCIFEREHWRVSKTDGEAIRKLLKKHYALFENMAGDMETLALNIKLEHSSRVLFMHRSHKRVVTCEDVGNGMERFVTIKDAAMKATEEQSSPPMMSHMYL